MKNGAYVLLLAILTTALTLLIFVQAENIRGAEPEVIVEHDVKIENLTRYSVNTTVEFHYFDSMNASEIRQLYQNGSSSEKYEIELNLTDEVTNLTNEMVSVLFNSSYHYTTEVRLNQSSLNNSVPNEQPIVLSSESSANLSRDSYDLPETANLEDVIYGTFNMGAVVNLDVTLLAVPDSLTKYSFSPPSGIVIEGQTSGTHVGNSVSWELDNTENNLPELQEDLRLASENPYIVHEESVQVQLNIDRMEFDKTVISVKIDVFAVKVAKYGNLSKNIVSLDYITSDGIRMVVNNGLLNWSWEEIYRKGIRDNKEEIEESISQSLNMSLTLNFSWDNSSTQGYDVNVMGDERAVVGELSSGEITPQLYALGEETFSTKDLKVAKGFLNAGGKADFEIPSMGLDVDYTPSAKLILSPGMRLSEHSASENPENNGRYSYQWNPVNPLSGTIYSKNAVEYTSSKIDVNVLVDIEGIELNYRNLQESVVDVDITGNLNFYRLETPEEVIESMPNGLTIDYIIADILRLALDSDLITMEEINDIINNKTDDIEEEMRDSMGENTFLHITVDENTLEGYDVDNMKDNPPIEILGLAHISFPISQNGNNSQDDDENVFLKSYVLKEFTMDFPMSPVEGWNVTYKILLPEGIIITDLFDDLGIARAGTENGRDYLRVTISDKEDNVTVTIGVTPYFVIDLLILPIILIILVIAAFISHRRSKKKRKRSKEKEETIQAKNGEKHKPFDRKSQPAVSIDRPSPLTKQKQPEAIRPERDEKNIK